MHSQFFIGASPFLQPGYQPPHEAFSDGCVMACILSGRSIGQDGLAHHRWCSLSNWSPITGHHLSRSPSSFWDMLDSSTVYRPQLLVTPAQLLITTSAIISSHCSGRLLFLHHCPAGCVNSPADWWIVSGAIRISNQRGAAHGGLVATPCFSWASGGTSPGARASERARARKEFAKADGGWSSSDALAVYIPCGPLPNPRHSRSGHAKPERESHRATHRPLNLIGTTRQGARISVASTNADCPFFLF